MLIIIKWINADTTKVITPKHKGMYDEDTLEELVTQSEIVRYRLQTIPFPLEKTNITGFIGNICIHIKGPETMARYVRMLAKFGEFSGVGIKTGMGMGAMKYIRRNEDD